MTFIVFLRLAADAGFYFFFAGTAAGLFGGEPGVVALGLALQCAVLTAGYLMRGKSLRYTVLLLPVLFIVLGTENLPERLALAAFMLYALKLLRSEEYEPTWDKEAELFSRFWKLFLAFLLLWLAFNAILEGRGGFIERTIIPGAIVTMAALILLTRALRHDRDVYVRTRRQLVDLAIFALLLALAAVLGSRPVLSGAARLAGLAFFYVVYPLLRLALALAGYVVGLVGYLFSLIFKDGGPIEMPSFSEGGVMGGEIPVAADPAAGEGSPLLKALLAVAGAAALAFAAYKLLKMLFLRGPRLEENGEREIERVAISRAEEPRTRERARTPVERVRREYRRFLRLCRQKGVTLRPRDTSLSVQEKSDALSAPDASARLRSLYIAARYDASATEDSAARAEAAYKQIKKQWHE